MPSRSKTKTTIRFWKMAKLRAEANGFRPGEPGYWGRVHDYFDELMLDRQLVLPKARRNPVEIDDRAYRQFHGVEPSYVDLKPVHDPVSLVILGDGVDVGYQVTDRKSTKGDNYYVHDFGDGVVVYRRAKSGEVADKVWTKPVSNELTVLGRALGFSYRNEDGKRLEVKGGTRRLATTPDRCVLVLIGKEIDYLIEGGNMHVSDWIRN